MISALVYLLIAVLVLGIVYWVITTLIPLPEPFRRFAQVILAVIFIIWLVYLLVPLARTHAF
jgi:hypothetical protein